MSFNNPHARRQSHRIPFAMLLAISLGVFSSGCGHTVFAIQVGSASSKLEEPREIGAENLAPYEFYFAEAHLRKARSEAAEADYSDAIEFAEISEEFAEKATRLARQAHRSAGR